MDTSEILKKARQILNSNWNGKFTIPSPTLYPHQWSWDSGFISIGNSYFEIERAKAEIEYLFNAQWDNGMIPHIVFNEKEKTYFPDASFYEIHRSPDAPNNIGTSGMTQPPVHAISCYSIYKNSNNKSLAREFLNRIFPKLMDFHRFLSRERDPENSGLITIFHPWESGLDDSPIWDEPLSRIKVQNLPEFKRLDVIAVGGAKDTIPSDKEYDKFIYLIQLMKQYNYQQKTLYKEFPFKIKDIVFSSIFYISNIYLKKISQVLGKNKEEREINDWIFNTKKNFHRYFFPEYQNKLGSDVTSLFYDYDVVTKRCIRRKTIVSLIPLFTGLLSEEDANIIIRWITHAHYWGRNSVVHTPSIPSTDLEVSYFKPMTYWRGPVWINTNWMIWCGLLHYNRKKEAELLRQGVLELVTNHGFREYYDPYNGLGLGGKDFSWTAALVIDMIMDSKHISDV